MTFNPNERPKCENPACERAAVLGVGRKLYCGACAVKVMEIKNNIEEAYIEEKLKNG